MYHFCAKQKKFVFLSNKVQSSKRIKLAEEDDTFISCNETEGFLLKWCS